MKTIIVLYGASSTGKTSTIVDVYDAIKPTEKGPYYRPVGKESKDFEDVVSYKGQNIAFFSAGDEREVVANAVDRYASKCDILIIAYNSGIKYLSASFLEHTEEIKKIEKCIADDEDNLRAKDAIMALIDR